MLSIRPQVGIWLCEATDPTRQVVDKGQPQVPGSQAPASHAEYGGVAENKIGALGQHSDLGMRRGEGRGEGALDGSHMGKNPLSGLWLEHRMAFWQELRHGSLGKSLSHCSSTS